MLPNPHQPCRRRLYEEKTTHGRGETQASRRLLLPDLQRQLSSAGPETNPTCHPELPLPARMPQRQSRCRSRVFFSWRLLWPSPHQ